MAAPKRIAMRIHDQWYDVTDFKHPGGPIMLSLGNGRDATGLFESHHPLTSRARLSAILQKYATDEPCELLDPSDTGETFVWQAPDEKDDGAVSAAPVSEFAAELRADVKAHFARLARERGVSLLQATKATPYRWFEIALMSFMFLATLPALLRGELWTLLVMPICNWLMTVNVFHDGSHFALSCDWRVNAFATYTAWYFTSPLEWYHQHVIGHHVYTNVKEKDPDLYHNGTMQRHTRTLRWRPSHRWQTKTWAPIWAIGAYAMSFLKPLQMFTAGSYNRAVAIMPMSTKRKVLHFSGRLLTWAILHALPFYLFPAWKAVLFAVWPSLFQSICFMVSSQINHLTDDNVDQHSPDFYKHQIMTSHDVGCDSYLVYLFTGGLNYQIEHHLFPCVNHCHHHDLQKIVRRLCKKYHVPYHSSATLLEALGKHWKHLRTLSVP